MGSGWFYALFPFQNLLEFFSKRCNRKRFLDESFGTGIKDVLAMTINGIASENNHLKVRPVSA